MKDITGITYEQIMALDEMLGPLVKSDRGVHALFTELPLVWAYGNAIVAQLTAAQTQQESQARLVTFYTLGMLMGFMYSDQFGVPTDTLARLFRITEIGEI